MWFPDTGFKPLFRNKFLGLFQDSDWFFQDSKIHINPSTQKISNLILLTACHTFHIFYLSLTDFQNFPRSAAFFQDFQVLENATIKFQDFPGFLGPVWTLQTKKSANEHLFSMSSFVPVRNTLVLRGYDSITIHQHIRL